MSTFRKIIPPNYKLPRVKSDRCSGCHAGSRLMAEIKRRVVHYRLEQGLSDMPETPSRTVLPDVPNTPEVVVSTTENEKKSPLQRQLDKVRVELQDTDIAHVATEDELATILSYLKHRTLSNLRKEDFDKAMEGLKDGECLMIGDYKSNMVLGKGTYMTDKEFFQAPECSVFGVVVVYKNEGKHH